MTNTKVEEFETYKLKFQISYEGYIIARSLFISGTKVRNIWDNLKDNDSKILAKSKECKNIVSAYSKYMKTADKAWASDANTDKLNTIISNQEKILSAINGSNAKDLDNKVKAL